MELDRDEVRRGSLWFVFAGLFALALSIFIYSRDIALEQSTYEKDNTNTMREIRTASGSVGAGNSDVRLRAEFQNREK